MMYEWNTEAARLGESLVEANHPHLVKLKIAYLFKLAPESKSRKPARSGKKKTWAKASLIPPKYEELLNDNYKFLIEFDGAVWAALNIKQKRALVDHELCHCGNDIDGVYMKHHDLEEFRSIVERYGFWKDDVRLFAESCATLFDGLETEPKPEAKKGEENTVTLSIPGGPSVTMTDKEFSQAAKRLSGRRGSAGKPARRPRI